MKEKKAFSNSDITSSISSASNTTQSKLSDSRPLTSDLNPPPIFSTWRALYIFILFNLAFMIALLYIFSISFK